VDTAPVLSTFTAHQLPFGDWMSGWPMRLQNSPGVRLDASE
jgi:hypothetical protein